MYGSEGSVKVFSLQWGKSFVTLLLLHCVGRDIIFAHQITFGHSNPHPASCNEN